jgi:hypothetical protein
MSGLEPESLEILEDVDNKGPRYPLGVRVDFRSLDAHSPLHSGFFLCAFETVEAARDIAAVIASKLGVEGCLDSTIESVDNILGEFLNIVIGLTCSDWADRGLVTEFTPPRKLAQWQSLDFVAGEIAFHLSLKTISHPDVSVFLVFLPALNNLGD